MPRGRRKKTDIFGAVRTQAAKALSLLQREIEQREADLKALIAQASQWRSALSLGRPGRPPGRAATRGTVVASGKRSGGKRVDWNEVLSSVPTKFTIEDVLKHKGAASKGKAQIYPAFSRWEAAKVIKRVAKGTYEKTSASAKKTASRKK